MKPIGYRWIRHERGLFERIQSDLLLGEEIIQCCIVLPEARAGELVVVVRLIRYAEKPRETKSSAAHFCESGNGS